MDTSSARRVRDFTGFLTNRTARVIFARERDDIIITHFRAAPTRSTFRRANVLRIRNATSRQTSRRDRLPRVTVCLFFICPKREKPFPRPLTMRRLRTFHNSDDNNNNTRFRFRVFGETETDENGRRQLRSLEAGLLSFVSLSNHHR